MNLVERLIQHRTKLGASAIGRDIIAGTISIEEFLSCLFSSDQRIAELAAWPMYTIADEGPEILIPHIRPLLDNLDRDHHQAVIRATMRFFECIQAPEEFQGEIYERSFMYLADPTSPIAIKVYAMTVCTNLCIKFPDLIPELITTIESFLPYGSAGYKSRAKKELKRLRSQSGLVS